MNVVPKGDAKVFRAALEELEMTQVAFANECGIADRQVRRYASSQAEIPKLVWLAIELLTLKHAARQLTVGFQEIRTVPRGARAGR